jgi:hypothetical protein
MQLFNLLSERVPARVSLSKRCNLDIRPLPLAFPCAVLSKLQLTPTLGYENLSSYEFATKLKSPKSCKSCGSSIGIDFNFLDQGEEDPAKDILAINVSTREFCFTSKFSHLTWDHRSGTSKTLIWMRWNTLCLMGRNCCKNVGVGGA